MIENIRQMMWELFSLNCKREDLIICMSPIIERLLLEQIIKEGYYWNRMPTGFEKFEGIEVNNKWPYNEAVIYHKEKASRYPQLLKKCSIEFQEDKRSVATEAK